MSEKLATEGTDERHAYCQFIRDYLRGNYIVSTKELEDLTDRKFTPDHQPRLEGKSTEKWRNDVHWARAWLTHDGKTITIRAGGQDWLCLAPEIVGEVHGQILTPADVVRQQIVGLVRQLAGKGSS